MLGLKLPTDPRWTDIAQKNIEEILIDHAYCEQKAASSAISLIIQYPEKTKLVDTLTEIVAEEWSHFERVLTELKKRGLQLGHARRDVYVTELLKLERKGGDADWRLLDKLLVCAIIEARSCERFRLLSQEISDTELRKFYYELMISEAGHYTTFVDLAKEYRPAEEVRQRLNELLEAEAQIIADMSIRGDRVH